jgi:hypothetical protein
MKAFDSVSPIALLSALRRFGIPSAFVDIVQGIYSHRTFQVKDAGITSGWRDQRFGISQGCPLSPCLFVVLMSVLMSDANQGLTAEEACAMHDLVYADDTLLLGMDAETVTKFMHCIGDTGREYGLTFNWKN